MIAPLRPSVHSKENNDNIIGTSNVIDTKTRKIINFVHNIFINCYRFTKKLEID